MKSDVPDICYTLICTVVRTLSTSGVAVLPTAGTDNKEVITQLGLSTMAGLLLVISTGLWCEGKPRYRNHSFATHFKHKTDKTRELHRAQLGK